MVKDGDTIVVWFSCGAASAVAAKLITRIYASRCAVHVVNNPIMQEDDDNRRFLMDVQDWIGHPILEATNAKFPKGDCKEVWDKRGFMSGVHGAPCTTHLKKVARQQWEDRNPHQWMVMGFTANEQTRHDNFVLTERSNLLPILIEAGLTKEDCFQLIADAGIELPLMYRLGYPNANCIGCVKATSPTYWNHVRKVHPEVFADRAEQSRRLGCTLVRVKGERIYLDELDPLAKGRPMKSLRMPECTIFCEEPLASAGEGAARNEPVPPSSANDTPAARDGFLAGTPNTTQNQ